MVANTLLLAGWMLAGSACGFQAPDQVEIIFLDVGQGDAILVRSPEGKVALIDAGPNDDILSILQSHRVDTIDVAIASHAHADHIGGFHAILESIPVRYYMDNGLPHTTSTYSRLMQALQASNVVYLEATDRTVTLGSVDLKILPPIGRGEQNTNSVGVVVEYGLFRTLLVGDAEVEELHHFLSLGVPDVTVLKAAHHGSIDGVTPSWLSTTKPEVVIISCGLDNPYGHPHDEAVKAYRARLAEVYRTDLSGEIAVSGTRDGAYTILRERTVTTKASPTTETTAQHDATEGPAVHLTLTVFADAPGNDHHNTNGEYVTIRNESALVMSVSGWLLCDAASRCYRFLSGSSIGPKSWIVVYTGMGTNTDTEFFWGSRRAIWNNNGDVATLFDSYGRAVARYVY